MSDVEKTFEPWQGFEQTSLPAGLEVPSPQRAGVVAKTLVSVFVLFAIASLLSPWTQNIRGRGRVVAYSPDQRQQPIEATISGRVSQWFVQEGSLVTKGDPIVQLADNDERILDRLGAQRSAVELQRSAQSQRLETLTSRVVSLRHTQQAEINAAEAAIAAGCRVRTAGAHRGPS